MTNESHTDPMDFLKNMWGNMGFSLPGMVVPTIDTDELAKRIADLKAVEGWLRTNLSLLQMTIQGLEMQRNTLAAFQNVGQTMQGQGHENGANAVPNPFLNPAAWPMPWNLMGATPPAAPTTEPPAANAPGASGEEGQPKR